MPTRSFACLRPLAIATAILASGVRGSVAFADSGSGSLPPLPSPQTFAAVSAWVRTNCDPHPDRCDNLDSIVVPPSKPGKPEFDSKTTLFFMDANRTRPGNALDNARDYANVVHMPVRLFYFIAQGDVMTYGVDSAYKLKDDVVALVVAGRRVHLVGYQAGGSMIGTALESARSQVTERSPAGEARAFMTNVTVETFLAPERDFPDGVFALQYVERGKPPIETQLPKP